jgi:hypothetical protein
MDEAADESNHDYCGSELHGRTDSTNVVFGPGHVGSPLAPGVIVRRSFYVLAGIVFISAGVARASVTLLLEEPFGTFGGMNPTGHAAIYLSRVCAASPISLRRCEPGEQGVVISRYHRVTAHDWLAIPLLPYLYAVDHPAEVPSEVSVEDVAKLRDSWRRQHLEEFVPDGPEASMPEGEWIQLMGAAYDRTIYAFGIETTEEQDDRFIQMLNSRPNQRDFNLLFHNCADFARKVIDFYYPHAVHRSLFADAGIMTPKQAARSVVHFSHQHGDLQFSIFVIPQVPGTVPRSTPVRGVLESLVKSKRYALPLVSVAVLHPLFGGSLALAWVEGSRFDPRHVAGRAAISERGPAAVAVELESNGVARSD